MVIKALSPIKSSLAAIVFLALYGCQEMIIENNDPDISISQGRFFYKGNPFTGKLRQENPAMEEIYITTFKNGLEDGEYIAKKKSGQLLEKRLFREGQKYGIHRSWFPNGNNRLYSEFDNGNYINDRWEWYDTGTPATYEKFDKDGRILVSKKWYRNGNIYMNVAFTKDGRSVGLPGSKLCNPIKPPEKKESE